MSIKILCVITGGTFNSSLTKKGLDVNNTFDNSYLKNEVYRRFSDTVWIDFAIPIYKVSENIDDKDWNIINREIESKINQYDGILLIHGTDTMAYTSSALSYNEQISKKKPIVITGANLPLSFNNTDAIVNFIQSIQVLIKFSRQYIVGVFIVFNGSDDFDKRSLIHLGCRVKKYIWEKKCYRSFYIDSDYLGYISNNEYHFDEVKYNTIFEKRTIYHKPIKYDSNLVSSFKIYPGFDPNILQREFNSGKKYFIIEIYSSGTAPMKDTYLSLDKSLKYISENNGIVFAVSQHESKQGASMNIYESSNLLKELNVISLKDIIWEAAVVKLMSATSLELNNNELIKYMLQNIGGEIT